MNKETPDDFGSEVTVPSSNTQLSPPKFMSWINNGWMYFVNYLTRRQELRVWQERNSLGDVYYHAYDPYTGRSTYLTSDTDLRIWLEKSPYQ